MLEYSRCFVHSLIFVQLVLLGLCGTYFNFCIVGFVCFGFFFSAHIARGRRMYDNLHTTYVMFIVMCCATSFVLQSSAVAQASRRMAFARRAPTRGACSFVPGVDSADQLVALGGPRECGLAAYRGVRLDAQYLLPAAGARTVLVAGGEASLRSQRCDSARAGSVRCFEWCVPAGPGACYRPAWSMVQNVYVTNALAVFVAADGDRARAVAAWPMHTLALAGGARLASRSPAALRMLATNVPGMREVDRMPEPYTDEFLVVEPLNASAPTTVALRLSQRCMASARVCASDRSSLSSSVTRLAHSAATAPCTILAVVTKCSSPGLAGCDWDLATLLTAHALNTLVLVASMYVACLTHAFQNQASPALVVLVAPCLLCLNWVPLLALSLARPRRVSLCALLLAALQLAQLSVLAYELAAADRAGLKFSETHAAVLVLAPCTALRGPFFFTSCVLSFVTTAAVLVDSFELVRLYPRE